jgi:hypothetical protein
MTFPKALEESCIEKHIDFHHKRNHVRCIAHIMNLAVQEILKYIKGDNAQEENDILMELSSGDDNIVDIIPKVRKTFYF